MNRIHTCVAPAASLMMLLLSVVPCSAQPEEPYRAMDYGPFLTATVEVSPDNIAQKGICIRLDPGPGGVAQGNAFAVFETDTLRYAAGWTGKGFIDWRGIIFNGNHGAHPKLVGKRVFANQTAPGWANPTDSTFVDPRLRGMDKRAYGPLPRDWGRWSGLYQVGGRTILFYELGGRRVLELPGFMNDGARIFTRSIQMDSHDGNRVVQIASEASDESWLLDPTTLEPVGADRPASQTMAVLAAADPMAAAGEQMDFGRSDFSITAWIKTEAPTGTIISKAALDGPWVPKGKTFFVRGGRLGWDVGWVGAVQSKERVDDGAWHHVAVTCKAEDGNTRLFIDGREVADNRLPSEDGAGHVVRLGYTATTFMPPFEGTLDEVSVFRRALGQADIEAIAKGGGPEAHARWNFEEGKGTRTANAIDAGFAGQLRGVQWGEGRRGRGLVFDGRGQVRIGSRASSTDTPVDPMMDRTVVAALVRGDAPGARWALQDGAIRLQLGASMQTRRLKVFVWRGKQRGLGAFARAAAAASPPPDLEALLGTPAPTRRPETVVTRARLGEPGGAFAVDELTLPTKNPWRSWIRLGGFDFFEDGDRAAVCSWQGDVWTVKGLASLDDDAPELAWRCVATGLFQPLGLKIKDDEIYVLGRDQITHLVDLNGDGETDFYENFNSDAQVTEHFHEFAMDLQTDAAGDFYYMKGARHAKTAVVPHHGTLIKVSADGSRSEIIARGFRAPNGLAVNDDGTFLTSDQEGHWTPMNRINWVRPGGFYGNMMAYVPDRKDTSYDPPICWIHKNTDRSPAAQLWVKSDRWAPLQGAMLSLSYGTGRIWNVLHEKIGDLVQGGVVQLPLPEFPTGIQRGRFHPDDGQLYACGLFGWSSNKTRPGGFYRVRRTAEPLDMPTSLNVIPAGVVIGFSNPLDPAAATDPRRYKVERWNYKRTPNYGSRDWRVSDGEQGRDRVRVAGIRLSRDGRAVFLQIPDMGPCMQMEINYAVRSAAGAELSQKVHHTVHALGDPAALGQFEFEGGITAAPPVVSAARDLAPGLELHLSSVGASELIDDRVSRWAALRVDPGEAPSPFLDPGPFTATFDGFIDVDLAGSYSFHADVVGRVRLMINGEEVLRGEGPKQRRTVVSGRALELLSGLCPIRVEVESPPSGAAKVRILWSGRGFDREPLPPTVLKHSPSSELREQTLRDEGRTLFADRSCSKCHGFRGTPPKGTAGMPELARDEPSLVGAGSRLERVWIFAWMLNPRGMERHASMPDLFSEADPAARQTAADIAAWVADQEVPAEPVVAEVAGTSAEKGRVLYEDLGCIACHTFQAPGVADAYDRRSLHYTDVKYQSGALRSYLRSPRAHHAWSRMPDFGLDELEAASLALHIRAESKGTVPEAPELSQARAARGEAAFQTLGCAACHRVSDSAPSPKGDYPQLGFGRMTAAGCLSEMPGRETPDFGFDRRQRASLQAFLATDGRSLQRVSTVAAAERAARALNCRACHELDGDPSPRLGILLKEGRRDAVPEAVPALTWAGEKLRQGWTRRLLLGELPYRARPWLRARMPAFPIRAETLARGQSARHGLPATEVLMIPDGELVALGEQLTRTGSGFSCIQCHGVGEQDAFGPFGDRGVNFTHVADRLRYDFYRRWMFAPQRVDGRTKMPQFAPDGKTTVVKDVLAGDAGGQFEALWHYLASSPRSSRPLVRHWSVEDLAPSLGALGSGRSFENGKALFTSTSCIQCHQLNGVGGTIGPDLSEVSEKHTPLAMLQELLEPSRVIEDKYRHHVIFTKDDEIIDGILVSEDATSLEIVQNALDPGDVTTVLRARIDERRRANVSSMPTGLLDTLQESEILDLMAFVRAGGNPSHPTFSGGK